MEAGNMNEEFKVGDIVKPKIGPHSGVPHEVIHSHGDGRYNIKPKGLQANKIKYRLGATTAQAHQLVKEDYMNEETLIGESILCEDLGPGTIIDMNEDVVKVFLEVFNEVVEFDLDDVELDEETEELEELSKKTLGSYIKGAQGEAEDLATRREKKTSWIVDKDPDIRRIGSRVKFHTTRKLDNRKKGVSRAVDRLTKEDLEDLDEARGRPPKQPKPGEKPTLAWQRHLERQKGGQEKEEYEALGAQLRKSISINRPVTFANGEKKEVNPRHAERFEDHMAARPRTQDKQEFQAAAHKSHDDFVKHVTSPIPKTRGGESALVNYR